MQEFFNDLELNHALLDNLASDLDDLTRNKYESAHRELIKMTTIVRDQANCQAHKIQRLCTQWLEFEQQYGHLKHWLHNIDKDYPKVASNSLNTTEEAKSMARSFKTVQVHMRCYFVL